MTGVREDFGWFVHAWDEGAAADELMSALRSPEDAPMLLVAVFCRLGWVEYGVSSRLSWLTERGATALALLETHGDGVFELEPEE